MMMMMIFDVVSLLEVLSSLAVLNLLAEVILIDLKHEII